MAKRIRLVLVLAIIALLVAMLSAGPASAGRICVPYWQDGWKERCLN